MRAMQLGRIARVEELSRIPSEVQDSLITALSDEGRPAYNPQLAAALAEHGVFAFGCTPDLFPELMSAALRRDDLSLWAARRGVVTARGED